MKITSNKFPGLYSLTQNDIAKNSSIQSSKKKIVKSFDELIINSSAAAISEDKFSKDVSNRILKEINTPASSNKIESLKAEIENGTYQIMPEEIVRKMMLR